MKTLSATKIGSGQFEINCFENNNLLGTFETNDAQLFDDVQEMRNDGFESELMTCETFEELVNGCFNKLKK